VTALLEYLDLVVQALSLQVVIFSAAEEYLFDFYNLFTLLLWLCGDHNRTDIPFVRTCK